MVRSALVFCGAFLCVVAVIAIGESTAASEGMPGSRSSFQVEISFANDSLFITWNDLPTGESYEIFASTQPYGDFVMVAEVDRGQELYAQPVEGDQRFYQVVPLLCEIPGFTIATENQEVHLEWSEPFAGDYRVYSSDDPYDNFAEDNSGTYDGASWTGPVNHDAYFYCVVLYNEEDGQCASDTAGYFRFTAPEDHEQMFVLPFSFYDETGEETDDIDYIIGDQLTSGATPLTADEVGDVADTLKRAYYLDGLG